MLAPTVTVLELGVAATEKSEATGFTIRIGLGFALLVKLPLVPLTVRLYDPAAVAEVVLTVIVDELPAAIVLGLKVAETPEGRVPVLRVTLPLNPFMAFADTV